MWLGEPCEEQPAPPRPPHRFSCPPKPALSPFHGKEACFSMRCRSQPSTPGCRRPHAEHLPAPPPIEISTLSQLADRRSTSLRFVVLAGQFRGAIAPLRLPAHGARAKKRGGGDRGEERNAPQPPPRPVLRPPFLPMPLSAIWSCVRRVRRSQRGLARASALRDPARMGGARRAQSPGPELRAAPRPRPPRRFARGRLDETEDEKKETRSGKKPSVRAQTHSRTPAARA